MRRIPPAAAKEFRRAEKAARSGEIRRSIEHLNKAIRIDPGYTEAHNNLAGHHMRLGDYEQAAGLYRTALALDDSHALIHANLSIALLSLGKYAESEAAARRGTGLDPAMPSARYVLGSVLFAQNRHAPEAFDNLEGGRRQPSPRALAATPSPLKAKPRGPSTTCESTCTPTGPVSAKKSRPSSLASNGNDTGGPSLCALSFHEPGVKFGLQPVSFPAGYKEYLNKTFICPAICRSSRHRKLPALRTQLCVLLRPARDARGKRRSSQQFPPLALGLHFCE